MGMQAMTDRRPEAGLTIWNRTCCTVGCHVFRWSAGDTASSEPLDRHMRCDCGLLTWDEAHPDG